MALITHPMQGSCALPKSLLWTRGTKLTQSVPSIHMASRRDGFISLNHSSSFGVGTIHGNFLKISAFKGGAQNDESRSIANGSKLHKNSVELSYLPQESEEAEEKNPGVQNVQFSCSSKANGTIAGSPAINKLFRKWLTVLRTQSSSTSDDFLGGGPAPREEVDAQNGAQKAGKNGILKAVWFYFLGYDLALKIPLVVFIPWYLAVIVVYGSDVARELMPLWVFGPPIVALYIKMLQRLCVLYVVCFKQTARVVRNIPAYYTYVTHGKLKEDIRSYIWKSVWDFMKLDHKEAARRRQNDIKNWAAENYLDYVESIWPYYCRMIRFLKRAHFI